MKNTKKVKEAITRAAELNAKIKELSALLEVEKNFLKQNLDTGITYFAGSNKALMFETTRTTIDKAALEKWLGKKIPEKCMKTTVATTLKIN